MTTEQMTILLQLLNVATDECELQRLIAFETDKPSECRMWLLRRDHFREARCVINSMISDAKR